MHKIFQFIRKLWHDEVGAITFGASGAPSQVTYNLDALFATSVSNAKKTLFDNISTSNAFWNKLIKSKAYKSVNGGTHIEIPLMYSLGEPDTYDGYDVLSTAPTDGITRVEWEWRQIAVPISISFKEERQNAQNIVGLLSSKIKQANMGMKEFIPKLLLHGNSANGGAITDNYVSPSNGSLGIEPLSLMVKVDPTTSTTIGNINQSTSTWWRNKVKSFSGITTSVQLLEYMSNLYNDCSKGPGGPPDIIWVDQKTFELLEMALFHRTRQAPKTQQDFPFENIMFKRAMVVWDEFMSDVANGVTNTDTAGTIFMLNSQFFEINYDSQGDFRTRPFQTPPNQDAKVSHILWMGNMTMSNRRKHGVGHSVPRTLTLA